MNRLIVLILCALLLFPGCAQTSDATLPSTPSVPVLDASITEQLVDAFPSLPGCELSRPAFRYGRSLMSGGQAALYDGIDAILSASMPDDAALSGGGIPDSEIMYTVRTFMRENPTYYWAELMIAQDTVTGSSVHLTYKIPPEEIARRQLEIDARAAEILDPVRGSPPFEIAAAIHDAIAAIPYDRDEANPDRENIYGALVLGSANCNGYASGFQYLAGLAGLESVFLVGESQRGIPHAWNAVRLDGSWHFVDCTWDHPLGEYDDVYHDYFLIESGLLLAERHPDGRQYPVMPQPSDGFRDYYQRMGYAVSGDVPDDMPEVIADILYRQLLAKTFLPTDPQPVFLEFKVSDTPEVYARWKDVYIKQVFEILRAVQARLLEGQAGFVVDDLRRVTCDYNDTTQVLTFYPIIRQEG